MIRITIISHTPIASIIPDVCLSHFRLLYSFRIILFFVVFPAYHYNTYASNRGNTTPSSNPTKHSHNRNKQHHNRNKNNNQKKETIIGKDINTLPVIEYNPSRPWPQYPTTAKSPGGESIAIPAFKQMPQYTKEEENKSNDDLMNDPVFRGRGTSKALRRPAGEDVDEEEEDDNLLPQLQELVQGKYI